MREKPECFEFRRSAMGQGGKDILCGCVGWEGKLFWFCRGVRIIASLVVREEKGFGRPHGEGLADGLHMLIRKLTFRFKCLRIRKKT
jgi:hypothetical protein